MFDAVVVGWNFGRCGHSGFLKAFACLSFSHFFFLMGSAAYELFLYQVRECHVSVGDRGINWFRKGLTALWSAREELSSTAPLIPVWKDGKQMGI